MSGAHVIRSFTLRTLRKNRTRTVVTIAGIALSAALLTAVLTVLSSLTSFLYEQEAAAQGPWHASAPAASERAIENARADARIGDLSVVTDVGFARPGDADALTYGQYLAVQAIDADFDKLCVMPLSEGRMPENSHEIVLHSLYRGSTVFSDEACEVGSQVTLNLGVRKPVALEEGAADGLPAYLDADFGYLDAQEDHGNVGEEFVEVGLEQTYTVVGFYQKTSMVSAVGFGSKAFTLSDADTRTALEALGEPAGMTAYFTTVGLSRVADIQECAAELFGTDQLQLHDSLLRYAGISEDRALWATLYQMAAILAVVVIVASASLIYNSFAISVADRTRQFGLLASIGASRRQVRRMVRCEALALAAVGVPLGVALGVGGSFVVLEALSPALSEVLGGGAKFGLHVDAASLLLAAVLALVAVAASAWLPARRASRVSAVDAVRNVQDVRLAPKKRRSRADGAAGVGAGAGAGVAAVGAGAGASTGAGASSAASAGSGTSAQGAGRPDAASAGKMPLDGPWKPHGLALGARLLGVPGAIAWRNATRSRGKGRVAVASLLLAVVLLVTAGTLNLYLGTAVKVAGSVAPYDVQLQAYNGWSDDDSAEQLTIDGFAALYAQLCGQEGVEGVGSSVGLSLPVSIPAALVGERTGESLDNAVVAADGTVETQASLMLVDDASYRAYLEQQGLDPEIFMDPEHPVALANRHVYGNDGSTYQVMDMFVESGSIQVYAYEDREGFYRTGEFVLPSGQRGVMYQKDGTSEEVTREQGAHAAYALEIGAVVEDLPGVVGNDAWAPLIVAPQSFASVLGVDGPQFTHALVFLAAFDAQDHAAAAKDMEAIVAESAPTSAHVADIAADQEQTEMLAMVVETFSLCFAGILALIAVANVFNTLVNSLMLRRREFAVLKSVGMDNRAFNRMIAWECVRFGVRGLAGGLVVSVAVAFLLFNALRTSISGLEFALPWEHVGMAVLTVALVTAASTAYGLRRSRANNVVEALRTDVL